MITGSCACPGLRMLLKATAPPSPGMCVTCNGWPPGARAPSTCDTARQLKSHPPPGFAGAMQPDGILASDTHAASTRHATTPGADVSKRKKRAAAEAVRCRLMRLAGDTGDDRHFTNHSSRSPVRLRLRQRQTCQVSV